jgi:thioredoxin reductase (NADPH)
MATSTHHKVIIIGSGPSGLAAAVYLSRAHLIPLMFAGEKSGGQLMLTTDVENYPGFPQGIMGPELMVKMREQAERFGTTAQDVNVTKVDFSARPFKIWAATGKAGTDELYTSDAVLISTGAETVWLNVPGEQEFLGRGVSSCAVCDAAFYKEKDTIVVGGGDAAMEDALALTKFAKSVTIIHRRESFRASKIMAQRVLEHPKVKVIWNAELKRIEGDKVVERAVIVRDGKEEVINTQGVFVAIGHHPSTTLFQGQLTVDKRGFLITRLGLGKESVALAQKALVEEKVAFPTMTSVEGVFAAGDVVDFRYKQAATASGMGVMAALDIEWWLEQ